MGTPSNQRGSAAPKSWLGSVVVAPCSRIGDGNSGCRRTLAQKGGLGCNTAAGTGSITVNTTNGGTYLWTLQDVTRTDGLSLLNISGNLNITASAGGFNLEIITFDSTGNEGLANLTVGTPYSLVIAHASGGITGFSPSAFTINASQFQNGTLSPTVFTLTQSGNDLYLNFTPIPEPSTYALLGLGLGAVLVPALRRRRSLKS